MISRAGDGVETREQGGHRGGHQRHSRNTQHRRVSGEGGRETMCLLCVYTLHWVILFQVIIIIENNFLKAY